MSYILGFYFASSIVSLIIFVYNVIINRKTLKISDWSSFLFTSFIISFVPIVHFCFIIPALLNKGKIDIDKMAR
jgi:hypothetical protein